MQHKMASHYLRRQLIVAITHILLPEIDGGFFWEQVKKRRSRKGKFFEIINLRQLIVYCEPRPKAGNTVV